MEVGAVKQAFNNEVILLKKKLNQAKIQIIHKLTRKAKTLTEKKAPEKLKDKLKKKAESAVKEVLIIKKLKARDVAKFIVTHKGQLNEYLNRPIVDQDKACARLLLHKALQDKYKVIRDRFSNISIEDLLMSRQERRKLKKEAKEKQKSKKKGKDVNGIDKTKSDWNVEDVNIDDSQVNPSDDDSEQSEDGHDQDNDSVASEKSADTSHDQKNKPNVKSLISKVNKPNSEFIESSDEEEPGAEFEDLDDEVDSNEESSELNDEAKQDSETSESHDDIEDDKEIGKFVKISPSLLNKNEKSKQSISSIKTNVSNKQVDKKHKDGNRNKNLNNKILMKKFNKDKSEIPVQEKKVVDPFFITATGENYMSVAEPRQADEVKEVHKQGNRQYRRAVMFGHVPKSKPRTDNFRHDKHNSGYSKFDKSRDNNYNASFNSNGFNKVGSRKRFNESDVSNSKSNFQDRNMNRSKSLNTTDETKPEKLHPSWEAKKRQSGILPFQGKKIVFDEG